ncbi:MAG: hypothetical protein JWL87_331 [Candidatus Adlerbacteria bacterium]|nr:hypothetical protein [Candidatus Adlerbacteria bacterium]
MNSDKKITRGEFLGALGGMAAAAVALKFASMTDTASAVLPGKVLSQDSQSYGKSTYGGKHA